MSIVYRANKGAALTHAEMDNNLYELDKIPNGKVFPKEHGKGIKIDTANPDFGWHDLHSQLHIEYGAESAPDFVTYRGGIKMRQFDLEDQGFVEFHIPHDYALGTEVFIHAHWSHASQFVTGGSVTWAFEISYAKGHNQAEFIDPIHVAMIGEAHPNAYRHMITETSITSVSGGTTTLPVNDLEVDGILLVRVYLDSNDLTVSEGEVPLPFLHFVDLHYKSTGIPTKNKEPNFYGV